MKPTNYDSTLEYLVERLDLVVREQKGESVADTMKRIRQLAIERRAGFPEVESRLIDELSSLSLEDSKSVIRWISVFFDLANVVEECQRIEVLQNRDIQARSSNIPRTDSIAEAIYEFKSNELPAASVQTWLDRLKIEPVFTAHPSEAKRRTIRQLLKRFRQLVPEINIDGDDSVDSELLANLTVLWQSDFVRPDRPPVTSEVSRGMYFVSTLWDVVPRIFSELRAGLKKAYPDHRFEIPSFLSFGSWIGGDRDGHPFVTCEITRHTLTRLRRAALEGHLRKCKQLHNQIVMSDQQVNSADSLRDRISKCSESWPELADRLSPVSQQETYRRFIRLLEFRLEKTLDSIDSDLPVDGAFHSLAEFQEDLGLLSKSMLDNQGQRVVEQYVQPLVDLVETFGFHSTFLDIRQNSEVHKKCLEEVVALQSEGKTFSSDDQLREFITQSAFMAPIDVDQLSDQAREVFNTFLLLANQYENENSESIGSYIISMTHSSFDVLAVLWLWKAAWVQNQNKEEDLPYLPIVPLFETIDDLNRAAKILDDLLNVEVYKKYLSISALQHQIVMVGYSDSTKDGGYLTACWELHRAQEQLAEVAGQNFVEMTVFHGRGGALGRGGGPAARAIRSLPPKSVNGRLRVTEQGEVLSERYDDPEIAHRHLEQIINATLVVSAIPTKNSDPAWAEAMEVLSNESFCQYRNLVEHPDFLNYFDNSTPISEIETLPIGSRPARRGQRKSLGDLRAIPWTFAWTQSRHILPAWFGLGTAVRKFVDSKDANWTTLRSMYNSWPMFTALIDNAELALAKADMQIAKLYANLSKDESVNEIWKMISSEFDSSRGVILLIKENHELLADINWLRSSVSKRNPFVDPLNLFQVTLLKRLRSEEKNDEIADLVRLSIQGVASGLRTTG